MDKKDKDEFRVCGSDQDGDNPLLEGAAYEAWQAACEYKQKEIDELKSTLIYVYDWYGMFMGDVAKDKIKKAVEGK